MVVWSTISFLPNPDLVSHHCSICKWQWFGFPYLVLVLNWRQVINLKWLFPKLREALKFWTLFRNTWDGEWETDSLHLLSKDMTNTPRTRIFQFKPVHLVLFNHLMFKLYSSWKWIWLLHITCQLSPSIPIYHLCLMNFFHLKSLTNEGLVWCSDIALLLPQYMYMNKDYDQNYGRAFGFDKSTWTCHEFSATLSNLPPEGEDSGNPSEAYSQENGGEQPNCFRFPFPSRRRHLLSTLYMYLKLDRIELHPLVGPPGIYFVHFGSHPKQKKKTMKPGGNNRSLNFPRKKTWTWKSDSQFTCGRST